MTFTLRDFKPSDGAAVTAITAEAFSQYQSALSDWPAFLAGFGRMVEHSHECEIIVAEKDGAIVGSVGYIGPGQPKASHYLIRPDPQPAVA